MTQDALLESAGDGVWRLWPVDGQWMDPRLVMGLVPRPQPPTRPATKGRNGAKRQSGSNAHGRK